MTNRHAACAKHQIQLSLEADYVLDLPKGEGYEHLAVLPEGGPAPLAAKRAGSDVWIPFMDVSRWVWPLLRELRRLGRRRLELSDAGADVEGEP